MAITTNQDSRTPDQRNSDVIKFIQQRNSTSTSVTGASITNPALDDQWARIAQNSSRQNNYFDYYFSGQDIEVKVVGIPETDASFGHLPIIEFAFNIEQQKMPVYGFWNYEYTTVLRGVRVVSGAFSIATTYPNYMRDLIAEAAHQNAQLNDYDAYPYYRQLTEDDTNIEKYWGSNLDPGYNVNGNNIFSVHPPFSLSVIYGVQDISVNTSGQPEDVSNFFSEYYKNKDNTLLSDENHRLVESSPTNQNRIVLDAVELSSCQRSFTSDGSVCVENYNFLARDLVYPNSV